jgi:hypothetical protein
MQNKHDYGSLGKEKNSTALLGYKFAPCKLGMCNVTFEKENLNKAFQKIITEIRHFITKQHEH